ncbi:MAG: NYN domain-containing protein [Gaiellaceae bacterium]
MTARSRPDSRPRAVVFIDYQNMYRSARDAFGWASEAGHFGNFRPLGLGGLAIRGKGCILSQVRVYTGIHTPRGNAVQYAMAQRRIGAWIAEAPERVQVFPRPLRYSPGYKRAQEKGVDVEFAIDFVRLALDDEFDVAVLASADTDLVPALQFVADRFPEKGLITLGYEPEAGFAADAPAPLDLPRGTVERRFIKKADFKRVADRRNFYEPRSDENARVDPKRWDRVKRRFLPR